MTRIFLFLLLIFNCTLNYAQQKDTLGVKTQLFKINEQLSYTYSKPKFFDMFRYIPKDVIGFGKYTIQKENLLPVGIAVTSTGILIPFDQNLIDNAVTLGSKIGWDNEGTYARISGMRILPSNIPAAVYYIGNGGTTLFLSGGFYAFGKINNDYRALNTASELVEVLLSVGVVSQTIKRIAGRQSPIRAIKTGNPGGHWTPFPSFKAYQTDTPNYDAIPSGHVATFMATVTVIATNYPEKKWIKPVGYSLMGTLAFQMMSSKVHWASDYPVAILMGYVIGKNAAKRRIKEHQQVKIGSQEINFKTNYTISNLYGDTVVGIRITF